MKKTLMILFFTFSLLFSKEFTMKTIEDEVLHFEITPLSLFVKEYPNRIVLLDFFGANCPPCIHEMPDLTELQKIYKKSIQIIGVQSSSKRGDKEMREFVKKHSLNYPVINLDEASPLIVYIQDNTGWNGALPYKLLYDFSNNLSYKLYGMMDLSRLKEVLNRM